MLDSLTAWHGQSSMLEMIGSTRDRQLRRDMTTNATHGLTKERVSKRVIVVKGHIMSRKMKYFIK